MSQPVEQQQAQPAQNPKEQELERNFAQQRKYFERQMDEQRRQYEAQLAQIQEERQLSRGQYDSDDDGEESIVDKKALRKELAKFGSGIEKTIDKKAEERARALLEEERKNSFLRSNPDFNQILSSDMMQKYVEKFPDMAETMMELPESFARQKKLYQEIKALGLHKPPEPVKPMQETVNEKRRGVFYQPSSSAAAPYANNGDFSQEGQKNGYKKMQDLINKTRSR